MAMQLNYIELPKEKIAKVSFAGIIESDDKLFATLQVPADFALEIHLEQLRGINSLGVRSFIIWSSTLKNSKITIHDAPKSFVDQLNMVAGLLPDQTRMRSFVVPYYSEITGEEESTIFAAGINFYLFEGQWKFSFPEIQDSKGNAMFLDIQPERYFKFLEKMK